MLKVEKFYKNTSNAPAHEEVKNIIKNTTKGIAIDLGCGSGRDTKELLRNGWKVIAIDEVNTEEYIKENLNKTEIKSLTFVEDAFKNVVLEPNDLTIAYFSLQNGDKKGFQNLWNKIENNIKKDGIFVGTFLGKNDSWKSLDEPLIFFDKREIEELFTNFEIIKINEVERDGKTGLGIVKHWHFYEVVAKKL